MITPLGSLIGCFRAPRPLVTVIRLDGVIGRGGPLHAGLEAARLAPIVERAFAPRRLAAVALIVNSPGGSPVQSSLIYSRIRAAAEERNVPVIAFVEDVAASGGYWLAVAADEIWADPSSIVGSIGVLFSSFGLDEAIGRLGIERRVQATGPRKGALDPFRPMNREDAEMMAAVQDDIFGVFKDLVRARRAGKLAGPEDELFSGAFWSGRRGLELGLIDGLGDARTVLRERFGPKVRLRTVSPARGWLRRRRRLGMGALGAGVADGLLAAVEERAYWSRYGL